MITHGHWWRKRWLGHGPQAQIMMTIIIIIVVIVAIVVVIIITITIIFFIYHHDDHTWSLVEEALARARSTSSDNTRGRNSLKWGSWRSSSPHGERYYHYHYNYYDYYYYHYHRYHHWYHDPHPPTDPRHHAITVIVTVFRLKEDIKRLLKSRTNVLKKYGL